LYFPSGTLDTPQTDSFSRTDLNEYKLFLLNWIKYPLKIILLLNMCILQPTVAFVSNFIEEIQTTINRKQQVQCMVNSFYNLTIL